MDPEPPASAGQLIDVDRVVEIPRVVGVDGDDERLAEVEAALVFGDGDFFGNAGHLGQCRLGKMSREMIFADDGQDIDAGGVGLAEHLDDFALRVDVARRPFDQFNDHLVTDLRVQGRFGVDVVGHARIVGDDIVNVTTLLKRADGGFAGPLQNANHPAGRFVGRLEFRPVTMQPDDHLVAMHGDPGIFSRNIHVGLRLGADSRFGGRIGSHKREAVLVELDRAHDEIGILRENETVRADADDLAPVQHLSQHPAKIAPFAGVLAQLAGQFIAAERVIIRRGEKRLDFLADVH